MKKNSYKTATISLLIFSSALVCSQIRAQEIAKCQDEAGNWHYGNFAAAECALSSDITTLNDTGTEVRRQKPPPTAAELEQAAAKKQAGDKAESDRERQVRLDRDIVQTYGSEEVILSTRNRKLGSIDNNLEITRQLKQGVEKDILALLERKQTSKVKKLIEARRLAIKSYDEVIAHTLFQRKQMEESYIRILDDFRKASAGLVGGS